YTSFFNDPATPYTYSLSLHDALPIFTAARMVPIGTLYSRLSRAVRDAATSTGKHVELDLSGSETELDNNIIQQISDPLVHLVNEDRKSTRLNSSHVAISYAVFCLKKK